MGQYLHGQEKLKDRHDLENHRSHNFFFMDKTLVITLSVKQLTYGMNLRNSLVIIQYHQRAKIKSK